MKICVIFTGGTIGSVSSENGYIAPDDAARDMLLRFFDRCPEHEFRFFEPVSTLSEKITVEILNKIADAVRSCADEADGIIITHGTDSLAYSAAALSYALCDINIPAVLVSSSHILTDTRANGIQNLAAAVTFIEQSGAGGVYVSWNGTIHCGTRLAPPEAFTAECKSILGLHYGRIEEGRFIKNPAFVSLPNAFIPNPHLEKRRILTLPAQPELCYDRIGRDWDAVLQLTYHSGTVDTDNPSFIRFCRDMSDANTPIFLHGTYSGADYESKAKYASLGLRTLPVMSAAAAYMKLKITTPEHIGDILSNDIITECRI